MSFSANAMASTMGASMAMSILQSPYAVVRNIQGNLTSPSPEEINSGVIPELFLTSYTPGFEPYRTQVGVEPVFTIVRQEVEHLVMGTTDIEIRNRYISVEEQPVRLDQTLAITSAGEEASAETAFTGDEITARIYSVVYTASEKELVSYASGIELQVSINEESNSSQTSYINSVASKKLEYNSLSVLGSTMAEQVDVAQQNIQSSRELAPATSETITDTGGTY